MLLVRTPGARADELMACLRLRVEAVDLKMIWKDPHIVLVTEPEWRTEGTLLQEIVAKHLDACDPAWRQVVMFTTGRGGIQRVTGSER